MRARVVTAVVLLALLSACGQEPPATPPEKTFGGRLGDSYQGMLDDARQSVGQANEQMQRTDQTMRMRDR